MTAAVVTDEMALAAESELARWNYTAAPNEPWRRIAAMRAALAAALAVAPRGQAAADALANIENAVEFLRDPKWHTWKYVEGSDIYDDLESHAEALEGALGKLRAAVAPVGDGVAGK